MDVILVPDDFPTISAAIEAIVNPTTIVIAPGNYAESLRVTDKQYVVLQSARLSRRGVTISGSDGNAVLSVERSTIHLSGVEIRSNGQRRGIAVIGGSTSLQECVITGNRSATSGAAMNCRDAKVRIQKSMLAGNTVDGDSMLGGGALYLENCDVEIAGASIQANAVYSTTAAHGGGILAEGGRMRMWRSRVTDNALHAPSTHGGGIYFAQSEAARLGGSVITGNNSASGSGGGVFVDGEPGRVAIHANTVVRQNHPDDQQPPK